MLGDCNKPIASQPAGRQHSSLTDPSIVQRRPRARWDHQRPSRPTTRQRHDHRRPHDGNLPRPPRDHIFCESLRRTHNDTLDTFPSTNGSWGTPRRIRPGKTSLYRVYVLRGKCVGCVCCLPSEYPGKRKITSSVALPGAQRAGRSSPY